MSPALATFSEKFPTDEPCKLWDAIQASTTHVKPTEKRAVARAIVKDLLKSNAINYYNAFYYQAEQLYPGRPFAGYNLMLFRSMPKFAKRASKKRSKTVLGWVHSFLTAAGEIELLKAFEDAIAAHLPA